MTVQGTGWQEHGADGTDVPINIGMTELGRGHPDGSGKFSVDITIPSDARPGQVRLDAIIGNGGSASASFSVTGASSGGNKSGQPPRIVRSETFREGVLVYARVIYQDPDGDAEGFGFRGVKGSRWAEESHPFSSPSYGRVGPGRVDYPFNHACGQGNEYESDVAFWVYDKTGLSSSSMTIHLSCSPSKPKKVEDKAGTSPTTTTREVNIPDWAGWSTDKRHETKTFVLGEWTVPQMDCAGAVKISRAAMWVGLWGPNQSDEGWLPQIGTQSVCGVAGFSNHFAVFQLYHKNGGTAPARIPEISVKAGDRVRSEVVFTGREPDGRLRFVLNLESIASEERGNQRLAKRVVYTAPGVPEANAITRGGCILEKNPIGFAEGGLAKFRNPFRVERCERDFQPVTQADTRYNRVIKVRRKDRPLAKTGDIGRGGAFQITWLRWR